MDQNNSLTLRRSDLLALGVLVLTIALSGVFVGALDDSPRGDDALFHLANARFLSRHWPDVWWFPSSHSGEPLISTYPLTYYSILAVLHGLNVPLEGLLQSTWLVSLSAIGATLYIFGRKIGLGHLSALGASTLGLTAPALWNVSLVGGAYVRVAALPFFFLSLVFCYVFLLGVRRGEVARGAAAGLILSLSLLGLLHPFVLQFAAPIVATLLVTGLPPGERLKNIARVVVPVGALTLWQLVPIGVAALDWSNGVQGVLRHDVQPMRPEWLVVVPRAGEWSIGLGLGLLILGIGGVVHLVGSLIMRDVRGARHFDLPLIAMSCLLGWSCLFILMAWLPMPGWAYLAASYDYVLWAAMTLAISGTLYVGEVLTSSGRGVWLQRAFVTSVVTLFLALLPWVRSVATTSDPSSGASYSAVTKQVVDRAQIGSLTNSRLGVVHRTVTRWLPYTYPHVQFLGGRSSLSPHRYFYEWMAHEIFYRYEDIDKVYFDDRPKVRRLAFGWRDNYYAAAFWADWFAVQKVIPRLPDGPGRRTAEGYRLRPHLFHHQYVMTRSGSGSLVKLRNGTGGLAERVMHPVAVPYVRDPTSTLYSGILELLSGLNLGPDFLVPVALEDGDDLDAFPAVLSDVTMFESHRRTFDDYLDGGGRLLLLGDGTGIKERRELEADPSSIVRMAASLRREKPVIRLGPSGTSVGSCSAVGAGTRCVVDFSMRELLEARQVSAGLVLVEGLSANTIVERHKARNFHLALDGKPGRPLVVDLPVSTAPSARGFLEVRFRATEPFSKLNVSLVNGRDERLSYSLEGLPAEKWHRFHVPLGSFHSTSWSAEKVSEVRYEVEGARKGLRLVLGRPVFVTLRAREPAQPIVGRWGNPNKYVAMAPAQGMGVLWKENHDRGWRAQVGAATGAVHLAGPGLIWVFSGGPARLKFTIGLPEAVVWGISGSVSAFLIWLLIPGLRRFGPSAGPDRTGSLNQASS